MRTNYKNVEIKTLPGQIFASKFECWKRSGQFVLFPSSQKRVVHSEQIGLKKLGRFRPIFNVRFKTSKLKQNGNIKEE